MRGGSKALGEQVNVLMARQGRMLELVANRRAHGIGVSVW
jgi:hypothetical protein